MEEKIFNIIEKIAGYIWKVIKFLLYLVISVIVIPSMLIMLFLHPTWEKWTGEVFQIGV